MKLFHGKDALSEIMPDWHVLSKNAATQFTYFQSAAWCSTWLEAHPEAEPVIATAWQSGELVMVLPLAVRQNFSVKCLETLSGPDAEYSVPLASDTINANKAFSGIVDGLIDSGQFDLLRFNSVPEELGIHELTPAKHRLPCDLEYSSIIELSELDSLDDYLASRSKSTRKGLRRKLKDFEKLGTVRSEFVPVTDDYMESTFPTICEWKRQWFAENGVLGGNFNQDDMQEQLKGFCQTDGSMEPVLATELYLDDKLVACDLVLQQGTVLYSYVTARNLDYGRYGVGTVMDMHTIKYAINNGYTAFDFLSGPNRSKDNLSNRKVPLLDLRFPLSEKGEWQSSIDRLRLRKHMKNAFYKMPVGVRQSVLAWKHGR